MAIHSDHIKQNLDILNEQVKITMHDNDYLIYVDDHMNGLKFNKKLGEGMEAAVYEVIDQIHGICAIKMIPWKTCECLVEKSSFQRESEMSKKMGFLGIGPLVYKTWIGKGYDNQKIAEPHLSNKHDIAREVDIGFILMEKMEYKLNVDNSADLNYEPDVHHCIRLHSTKILNAVIGHLTMLRDHGLQHDDLGWFGNNIMLNLDNDGIPCKIRLIDFGMMKSSFDYNFDHYIKRLGKNISYDLQNKTREPVLTHTLKNK